MEESATLPPLCESPSRAENPLFNGNGPEYFRIWIVNFALTLVTLGIFIPWARVRTRRYFYQNTTLDGENFHYIADPKKLLVGYLLVGAALLLWMFGEFISIWMPVVLFPVFVLLYPWVRWKSIRFFATYSTYRHLRLRFAGSLGTAYKVYLGLPVLTIFTMGLLWPYVLYRGREYFFSRFQYGTASSEFSGSVGFFYRVALICGGIAIAISFAMGIAIAAIVGVQVAGGADPKSFEEVNVLFIAMTAASYGGIFLLFAVANVLLTNHSWSRTVVRTPEGSVRFRCEIEPARYIWILVSNLFLTVVTLGIYLPFAKVRIYRYRLSRLQVSNAYRLASVTGGQAEEVSAVGESASDWLDLDFGL